MLDEEYLRKEIEEVEEACNIKLFVLSEGNARNFYQERGTQYRGLWGGNFGENDDRTLLDGMVMGCRSKKWQEEYDDEMKVFRQQHSLNRPLQ